jgi:hypothetical protein
MLVVPSCCFEQCPNMAVVTHLRWRDAELVPEALAEVAEMTEAVSTWEAA